MTIRNIILLFPLISVLLSSCQTLNQPVIVERGATINYAGEPEDNANSPPVTILISIDGFHPDYLKRSVTPRLNALAEKGSYAPMRPAFPTKTFPNHFTLVTGKRPDNHGIVGNRMEDIARPDEVFTMANKDIFWWQQAEPLWVTAEKQGISSATMFWPGSEVEFGGVRPANWWPFNQDLSNDRRVNAVLDWVRRPAETRPKLITLYFDTVDSAGHFYGPAPGEKLHQALAEIDDNIAQLVGGLEALGQPANLVIFSDHGMTETGPERVILLDKIMPRDQYHLVEQGNYAGIEPVNGNLEALKTAFLKPHDHMECWERGNIPAAYQYGANPRVPRIFCLPTTGWLVYQDIPPWLTGTSGGHGYDHRHPDMTAIFIAYGANIKAGQTLPIFDNVHVYSLLAQLSGIKPLANDGDISALSGIIKD